MPKPFKNIRKFYKFQGLNTIFSFTSLLICARLAESWQAAEAS